MSNGFKLYINVLKGNVNYYAGRLADKLRLPNSERGAVRIHDMGSIYGDAVDKLWGAKDMISNFVKKNNLSVDVYDARRLLDDSTYPLRLEDELSKKIQLVVKNLKNGKTYSQIVDANTDKTYMKQKRYKYITQIPGEETQIARTVVSTTEDTFLRNFYRELDVLACRALH